MFATKRRLQVALMVVGFLVVSLGMYAAFRPQQAEAHCSTVGRVHDYYDWETGKSRTATGNEQIVKTTCSRCTYPVSDHKQIEIEERTHYVRIYKHRWFWSSNWDHCHSHKHSIGIPFWYTVLCDQSSGGG